MKRFYTTGLVLMLVVLFSATALAGNQFQGDRFGPKAHGMGGAFTAVADDASAIYWNPAGLVRSGTLGLQTNLGGSFSGLGDIDAIRDFLDEQNEETFSELEDVDDINLYLDGMASANLRNFGIGLIASNSFEARVEDVTLEITEGTYEDSKKLTASNKMLGEAIFSMGTEVAGAPLGLGNVALGANAKYLQGDFQYASYEPVIENNEVAMQDYNDQISGQGFGVDAGALVRATNMLNVGVNVRNLVSYYDWEEGYEDYDDLGDEFQRRIRIGAAANLPFPVAATVAADLDIPDDFDSDKMIYHLGVEKNIVLGLLSARGGLYGQNGDNVYTAGLGINVPFVDINVAGDIKNEFDESRYFSASATVRF